MPSLRERLKVHAVWLDTNLDYMEAEVRMCDEIDAVLAAAEALKAEHAYRTSAEFWQKMRDLFALFPSPDAKETL